MLKSDIVVAFKISLIFLIICGIVFPLLLTGIAQVFNKQSADGSLIQKNGTIIGSAVVGQTFTNPKYFQSRPPGVSNWGPNNPSLIKNISTEVEKQKLLNNYSRNIPIDLVTQSGSGADPHITKESALLQIPRISKLTGISQEDLRNLVEKYTEEKLVGIFSEPRVNVLQLNLGLEDLIKSRS
jgi:K+-transporting ATPase ATPase C chain